MIKFKYGPSGNVPIQSEGYFLGKYFYFRARGERAYIEFAKDENHWDHNMLICRYTLARTKDHMAGWLPKWYCWYLIFKGFVWYIFKVEDDL